ncbi:Triosephosphate isomerase [Bisporella sp. PMI_857]|nr:Triosephosphate isomerase [Bisporella sp. PMI_857]
MPRQFFVWWNGSVESIKKIIGYLNDAKLDINVEVVIAPPSLYLLLAREHLKPPNGAFTGEISVDQLKDSKINWTLLGHSERRTILREDDSFIAAKTKAALDGGIGVILCCGESLEEREANKTIDVVTKQLKAIAEKVSDWSKIVIAYEPIWAIGTGKGCYHRAGTRSTCSYSGLVKERGQPRCCRKHKNYILVSPDIDGFLVGGASLKPAFVDIINSHL